MSVEPVQRGGKRKWRVRYRDHAGNPKTETYDLKADATARDAAIAQAKQRKEPIPLRGRGNAGQTFEAFARDEWWTEDVLGRRLTAKTQQGYAELLDGHLIPRVGHEAVAFIDVQTVLDLRARLAADGVPDYSSARVLKLFRQILGYAVVKRRLQFNPADVLRGKGALPSQSRTTDIRPIPPEQTEALRRNILASRSPFKERDAMLVSLIAYAGLRPEEALALCWEHVGTDSLRVEHANANGEITRTKTGWRRTVRPLIPALADDLADWREKSKNTAKHDLIICHPDGTPLATADYGNWRGRVFKKHLPDDAHPTARPYDLRHGWASLLIREGVDVATVAKRMGNSPTTTTAHYTHVFEAYEGKPRVPMAQVVADARSRGHNTDTSARATPGHAGTPKGRKPSSNKGSSRKRVPA
jgi:integrase